MRWLENAAVRDRALQIRPSLKKWVDCNEQNSSSQVFEHVKACLDDPLLPCKLHFFKSVALLVEPFLSRFQSNEPFLPLMHDALQDIIQSLLSRFMEAESHSKLSTLKEIAELDLKSNSGLLLRPNV